LEIGNNDAEMLLQPFDHISVRQAPNYRNGQTAYITGEVSYAGAYSINNKQQRISDLVALAGGVTPQAYIDGATLQRFSDELGTESVAINLREILDHPKGRADLFLNNGDRIDIPEFMQTVKITGSVQNPFSITYQNNKNAKYYITRTGGFASGAHKKKTYVRYPNGETAVTKGFIFKAYPAVQPGSQIIVPQKPEREGTSVSTWLAITSALSSLAIAIAAVLR
jgi:protein involved in polysaccharide export with SLBB domain